MDEKSFDAKLKLVTNTPSKMLNKIELPKAINTPDATTRATMIAFLACEPLRRVVDRRMIKTAGHPYVDKILKCYEQMTVANGGCDLTFMQRVMTEAMHFPEILRKNTHLIGDEVKGPGKLIGALAAHWRRFEINSQLSRLCRSRIHSFEVCNGCETPDVTVYDRWVYTIDSDEVLNPSFSLEDYIYASRKRINKGTCDCGGKIDTSLSITREVPEIFVIQLDDIGSEFDPPLSLTMPIEEQATYIYIWMSCVFIDKDNNYYTGIFDGSIMRIYNEVGIEEEGPSLKKKLLFYTKVATISNY